MRVFSENLNRLSATSDGTTGPKGHNGRRRVSGGTADVKSEKNL